MEDKNIEMMKKLIEEKKKKGSKRKPIPRPNSRIGEVRKAIKTGKTGGLFDK